MQGCIFEHVSSFCHLLVHAFMELFPDTLSYLVLVDAVALFLFISLAADVAYLSYSVSVVVLFLLEEWK